jgi:hypothetical protein
MTLNLDNLESKAKAAPCGPIDAPDGAARRHAAFTTARRAHLEARPRQLSGRRGTGPTVALLGFYLVV